MKSEFTHNKFDKRFELHLENNLKAFVSYTKNGNHLSLIHSEVPVQLRGQGVGKDLVLKTFEAIRSEGYTATAYCSYIIAVRRINPNYSDVIHL
jgi:predicted GNAT family acetyltransferase